MKQFLRFLTCICAIMLIGFSASAQTTVTIYATGAVGSYNTGSVNSAGTKNDGNMITINSSTNRGWAKFDLSTIPAGALIVSANAIFTTYSSTSSAATNNLYGFLGDPFTIPGTTLYTNCGSGASFAAGTWTANATNTFALNASGTSFLQSNFGGFVNIGYVRGSTNTYNIYGYPGTTAQQPQLVITYTVPAVCSGTPSPGATNANPSTACPGGSVTLNLPSLPSASGYTFQWQSSPDGITWTNIPGATNATYTGTINTVTYYQCIVTCTNSSLSATSTPVMVNVAMTAACYCTSFATTTADEEIFNVTIGSLNNSSTCATVAPGPGSIATRYANYTSGPGIPATPAFAQGSLVNSSITVNSCGTFNYTSGAAIFIDYNQDGDFLDAGEMVWNNGTTANINCIPQTIVPGSFTVPLSATPGITVMRIIDAEGYAGSTITPCLNTYGYGETEDYLVNIVAAVACSGTPSPGATNANPASVCPNATTTLTLPSIPPATGYTYQWQSSPDGITWTNIPSATGASYTATLTVTTYYQCIVTCTNSSLSAASTPVMVPVSMSIGCYCSSSATTTADEEIFNVKVSNLNNSSVCATVAPGPNSVATRYANYTSGPGAPAAVQLQQGYSYNDSITVSSCGTFNYTSGAAIFIDYNQDGDFLDAGEMVWNNGSAANINCIPQTIVPGSFTVPITALTGTTYMRIIDAEGYAGTSITPCLSYGYGETEDYLVNILPAPPVDMGATLLAQPFTSGCHTSADSIIVQIKNYSLTTIDFSVSPVTVNVNVTGPNPGSFPVTVSTGTLAGNATMNVLISNNYNMSSVGTYTFTASTSVVGDGNASNNAMSSVGITVSGGVAMVSNSNICSGSSVDLNLSGYTNGGSIQWESSTDNITFTPITGATTNPYTDMPGGTTYYHAVVCGLHTSVVDTVNTITVSAPTAINASRCGNGSITIGATASDSVNWFTGPTGGTSIHTGSTYTTSVATTTTFYAENTFTSCGAGGMPATPTCYPTYSSACSSADFINNFSTTLGSTNISNLNTGCNGSGPSNTTFFPGQVVTCSPGMSFNFAVQSGASWGQGHHIWIDYNNDGDFVDPGEDIWASPSTGTGLYTGTITVPSNTTPGPKRIRVMCRYATIPAGTDVCSSTLSFGEVEEYTLNVCTQCSSTRIPVVATVTTAPSITTTAGNTSLCGADTTVLAVSSSNSSYSYTWSPATALNSTAGDSVMFMPTAPGSYTYYVDAVDASSGCNNRDTLTVMMTTPPSVTGTVDVTPICSGSSVNLSGVQPPSTVQVTNGNVLNTSTTYPAPYGQFYGGSRHQMLILASELTAAGLTAGNLTGLTFQVTNANASAPLTNFTIQMGTTALTDLSAGFATYSAITVYTSASYAPTVGVNTHTFSTPFYWDGVSNIIVETCFANYTTYPNTTFTTNATMRQITTPFVSTAYNRYDNTANICSIPNQFTASQRPNIAFIHSYSSWTYGWTPTASLATPNAQNTVATPPSTTDYIVTVTDSVSGCTAMDTVHVDVNPSPAPMFGPDTAICSNTTLVLDGTAGPNYTYLWNDNSTNQTLPVNAFGIYDVLVTDSVTGCTGTDTILVGINAAPAFSLGSDVTICAGNTVTFSGPSGQYHYMWNTTATSQAVTVGTASNYELTVTDTVNSCFNSDTVALFVNPLPSVNLGNDTAICSANLPYVLSAPAGAYTYNWSDMTTNQTLNVTATGTYYVVVTDNVTTCYSSDTVIVSVNSSPVVSLGNDSTFCSAAGPITLMATAGPYNYLWSDFSTGMSLTTNTSGMYDVTVTDSITGCAAMDTVSITVNQSPIVNLGNDTSLCGGSVTLDAQNAGSNYMWSTTANTQTIVASSTANYYVDVTSPAGCTATDSIMVTVNTPPTVTFNPQTPVCVNDGNFALTGSPTGGTFTGLGVVSGNMFSPATAGVGPHTVTYSYTDGNGCFGSFDAVITVNACTGVNEPFVAAEMNVYPNPNNGSFTLTINDADYTEVTMELITVEGRVIYSDKASNVKGIYVKQLDLNTEANGIYFLRVTANGQSYMQKIVKQD